MNAYVSARVGIRQWRVLLAADTAWPGAITAKDAGEAIRDSLPFSAHRPVLEALLDKGLLAHVCDPSGPGLDRSCLVCITDRGARAGLSRKGREAVRL